MLYALYGEATTFIATDSDMADNQPYCSATYNILHNIDYHRKLVFSRTFLSTSDHLSRMNTGYHLGFLYVVINKLSFVTVQVEFFTESRLQVRGSKFEITLKLAIF